MHIAGGSIAAAVLAVVFVAMLSATGAAAQPAAHSSIVGGHSTPIQDAPFQVAIYDPQVVLRPGETANPVHSQFCAGVVRDATHVITAGHCVMNQLPRGVAAPSKLEVLAGTSDLNTSDGQAHDFIEDPVAVTSFNPSWEPEAQAHDVGLLTLAEPLWHGATPSIDGESRIAPITLAESLPGPGTTLTVSGWGYTKEKAGGEPPSEEGVPLLRSTQLPLVSSEECLRKYAGTSERVSPGTVCAGSGGHDACYQDSGGPLFEGPSSPPGNYRLIGTVDFGYGCGLAAYPGVFQSMADAVNRQFLLSNPPQAPLETSAPGISGTASPGHTLTCLPGSWTGQPSMSYAFYADQSSTSTQSVTRVLSTLSPQATYTVRSTDAGERIFCRARATNAGGYDFDNSADLTVPGTASLSAQKPNPPGLKVVSKMCIHRRCIVNVRAYGGAGAATVTKVRATITFKRTGDCRRHGSRRTYRCTRTVTFKAHSQVKAIPGGHFVVLTPRLPVGRYILALVAVDQAGVRQLKPTDLHLRIGRRHSTA